MKKNNKGFSLIELMVVVAIIGILSAVAVPQFQKFQRKAKQTEAKSMLTALYTSQKVFRTEYNTYYRNIYATGFIPEGSMRYVVSALGTGAPDLGLNTSPYFHFGMNHETHRMCRLTYTAYDSVWDPDNRFGQNCKVDQNSSLPTGLAITNTTFTVGAGGKIGGSVDDHWTINHRKEIINTQNGAL